MSEKIETVKMSIEIPIELQKKCNEIKRTEGITITYQIKKGLELFFEKLEKNGMIKNESCD